MTPIIYEINNTENEKRYIGSTSQWKRRKYEHTYLLEQDEHGNNHLQNAWNKYGADAFEFSIIEETDQQFAEEQNYLDEAEWSNLYNISKQAGGGDIFSTLSKEGKKRFREKSKHFGKENGMYGETHTEEAQEKMKEKADGRYTLEWFIGRYGEEEGRQKYEKRRQRLGKNRSGEDNPFYGKNHDDSTKEKISQSMKEVAENEEWRNKVSESRKGKATGKDNPRYKHVPKEKLKRLVKESSLKFGEIADEFDVSTYCLRQKMKNYFGKTYSEMT
jgi:group I intron endonuclease